MVASPVRATLADLANTPDDGQRYELIDGEIIATAAPTWRHQQVVGNLHLLLRLWVDPRSLGEVALAPVDIILSTSMSVQPDLVYVSAANLVNLRDGRYYGTPDLAVEVISPTNQSYDTVTKLFRYARAAIPEYWLVDPTAGSVLILSLVDGIYVPQTANDQGTVASVVLPGLSVDPAAVFGPGIPTVTT
ncbi:MAG: hypothetical protein AVDCRST_MAG33-2831 [uncultured Thermomicrobiales bacterium]|uniref:Putative restriction endonuclease domain-containing protein n=1 Tax=uncultured Thermomicrobiales bacterium TaxID=1645740 RepID=A0A6J4VB43_9BACT|nr:MAG: hypothetical protein AVDCRST_MAG33-2831 [uncultured Thermomicrobiales bacterium]